MEFVQFHPSYGYSDFVEGLRPKVNDDGTMGFELQDGIFKKFVARARKNYEDSQKSKETIEKELSVQESMTDFFSNIELGVDSFDFAMRRRFRFVELRADERLEMLASLENEELEAEAIKRMAALNKEIANVEDLNVKEYFCSRKS